MYCKYFKWNYVLLQLLRYDVYLCNRRIINTQSFFLEFCDSHNLNIFVIDNPVASELTISAKEVQTKCLKLLISNSNFEKYVILLLIHYWLIE